MTSYARLFLAMLCLAITAPAFAATKHHVPDAPLPPPTTKVDELVPADRDGYLWVEGNWQWSGKHYVWHAGRWEALQPGKVWIADAWQQRGKRWHFIPGHWGAQNPNVVTDTHRRKPKDDYHNARDWPRVIHH